MDNVHNLRNTYGADLVAMLVDTGSVWGTVGMGYELTSSSGQPNYAFTVSAIRSVDISETLTHEVGHNFGCGHSKEQKESPGPGLYSYSAGWYFEGTDSYSTIMAYTDKNGDNITDHDEAPCFSNPDVRYDGGVTGDVTNGDNARTIWNTMDVVASYQTSVAGDSTPDQFNFIDQTNVARDTLITSNAITVNGINAAANISITGGEYSINRGSYTSANGTVNNGNIVTVQLQSSPNYSTMTTATLTIGGVSDVFNVTTLTKLDTDPNPFYFIDRTNVQINTEIISNTIIVSGINAEVDISVTDGQYSINDGPYTGLDGKVNNGDKVTVQLTSSSSYLTEVSATLVISGISDIWNVKTRSIITPDQFIFIDQVNVPMNTTLTSNAITVSGLGEEADIGIIGGEYKINSGPYTSSIAKAKNNDTVTVRQTSANGYSTTTHATLTIGGVSDTFSVTTVAAPDSIPAQFTFTDQANVPTNTVITSNIIVVSGINTTTNISITGGTYSINGNAYTNTNGTVNVGDNITVQQISSVDLSTTTPAILTIGGISDTFSVTTKDKPASKGDGGGGGCFIATAAFGFPLAGQVEILRQFRDRYLLTNAAGKKFVVWYYRNGPAAAHWIMDKPVAKAAVRAALYPLIGFSFMLISGCLPFVIMMLLLSVLVCVRFRTKKSGMN